MKHSKMSGLDQMANPHLMLYISKTGDSIYIIPVRKNGEKWAISGTYDISKPIAKVNELDDLLDFLAAQGHTILSRDIQGMNDLGVPLVVPARGASTEEAMSAAAWLALELHNV